MKKLLIIGTAVILGIVIAVGIWIFTSNRNSQSDLSSPVGREKTASLSPTPAPVVDLTTRDDPAGFAVKYPKTLSLNDHPEDTTNYAYLEFSHPDYPGNISIWVKDPPKTGATIAAWIASEKRLLGLTAVDTTLGGQPAKKFLLAGPPRQLLIGTVFDGVVFSLEANLGNDDFWEKNLNQMIDNFTLKPTAAADTQPPSVSGSDLIEEEVIE